MLCLLNQNLWLRDPDTVFWFPFFCCCLVFYSPGNSDLQLGSRTNGHRMFCYLHNTVSNMGLPGSSAKRVNHNSILKQDTLEDGIEKCILV